jgi:hypothetical protein
VKIIQGAAGFLLLFGTTGCCRPSAARKTEIEFQRKLSCQRLRADIEKNAEQGDHEIDGIYSVFYSSKMNSCLVAKVIVWDAEWPYASATAEIDDVLDQRTVWAHWSKDKPINMTDLHKILDTHIDNLK